MNTTPNTSTSSPASPSVAGVENITFTASEIAALQKDPDALRSLAAYHELRATEADSIGPEFFGCVEHHEARSNELLAAADRIEASY